MQNYSKDNIFSETINKKHSSLFHQLVLCITFVITYLFIFDVKLDLNGDNFEYLNLAKSIVSGRGYVFPYNPDYPPTNWFPPGYPSILAVIMFFAGNAIILFKVLNGLFFLGSILLHYTIIKRITQNVELAFTICMFVLLNCGLLRFSTIIMSEIPYLFFSVLTIYYIVSLKEEDSILKSKRFYLIILFATATFYIRTIGIVLVGAIVLHWLLEKRWKIAITFLSGFILLYLPWMIRNSMYGLKSRYMGTVMTVNAWRPDEGQINTVSSFIEKMKVNFYDTVIKGFTEVLLPFIDFKEKPVLLIVILGSIIVILTFFGAWKLLRYKFLFIFYLIGNIFILLIWHQGNSSRYVWPLAPFITFLCFNGIYSILKFVFERKNILVPKLLPYSFLILTFFFVYGLQGIYAMAKEKEYEPPHKNYFEMAEYIKRLNNPNLLVACRKQGMFYYFAGCYVTNYKDSESDREIITDFIDKKVDYLVLEKLGYSSVYLYMRPAVEKNMELFDVVYSKENPNTFLLKFNIEKAKLKFNYNGRD